MAGRPKRRAKLAAQWAEVDRAAGRTQNAGRAKALDPDLHIESPANLGDCMVAAKDAPDPAWSAFDQAVWNDTEFRKARAKVRRAADRAAAAYTALYAEGPPVDGTHDEYVNAQDAHYEARWAMWESYHRAYLARKAAGGGRTSNAGRPKREVRVAGLTWDEWQASLARQYRTAPGQPYRKRNGSEFERRVREAQDLDDRYRDVKFFTGGDYGLHGGPYKYVAVLPPQPWLNKVYAPRNLTGALQCLVIYIREDGTTTDVPVAETYARKQIFEGTYGENVWPSGLPPVILNGFQHAVDTGRYAESVPRPNRY